MIEKVTHVRNPLTVIAMFAGIAEVSGTIVLPFLETATQSIYVWFLMLFPCILVIAFFGTLLFKHHVLYAPSDFKDERLFASMFKPGSPQLREKKLEEESSAAAENEGAPATQGMIPATSPNTEDGELARNSMVRSSISETIAQASLAEDLVVTRLASERQVRFIRNVSPAKMSGILFDAVANDGNNQLIVEVKYTRHGSVSRDKLRADIDRFKRYYLSLTEEMRRGTSLIIALVLDGDAESRISIIKERYSDIASDWNLPVQVRVFSMTDLKGGLGQSV